MITLGELADRYKLQLRGDAQLQLFGICTLTPGKPGHLGFLSNPHYRAQLAQTRAAAVILSQEDAQRHDGPCLIARDPYLAFARVAAAFAPAEAFAQGIHPSAVVDPSAQIADSACIAAQAVIAASAVIGEAVYIGPGTCIGREVKIGANSRLEARVTVEDRVQIGARVRINSGAVIGSRGFGLARGEAGWEEVPQMGSVVIGDQVEIGANTSIDRGAIENTVIGFGAKIDNQVQIAHNVSIGEHTAIAACVGIAGSAKIGARCLIGGGAGISGHLEIGDEVMIMGFTMVTKSLAGPGQYGSGVPALPVREWRRQIARGRRLEQLETRLKKLETAMKPEQE